MARRIFLSYASADAVLRDELDTHLAPLRRAGAAVVWHDRKLHGGDVAREAAEAELDAADVILLLVTPDFLASDELQDRQVQRALARGATSGANPVGRARVVPVLVRACLWEVGPLAALEPLPRSRVPVASWADRDAGWKEVVEGVLALITDSGPPRGAHRGQDEMLPGADARSTAGAPRGRHASSPGGDGPPEAPGGQRSPSSDAGVWPPAGASRGRHAPSPGADARPEAPGGQRSSSSDAGAWSTAGLATPEAPWGAPVPNEVRALEERLSSARAKRERLARVGATAGLQAVEAEILELRRRLRERGQLAAGDALSNERYVLVELLGKGGFATVWRAHDEQAGKEVAIKVLHPQLTREESRRERFFRGARVMAGLRHPGIVRVLEAAGHDRGFDYFVMELVGGGTLRDAILEGRVGGSAVLEVLLKVGEALCAAHAAGHVHRDVKPANILLDEAGNPLLTDFDLVGGGNTTGGTRTGAMGTFLYAAPEALVNASKADGRADVYGLGMTGVFCYHGEELPPSVMRDVSRVIGKLACPEGVRSALLKATEWEVEDRWPGAEAFCEALRGAVSPRGEAAAAGGRSSPAPGPPAALAASVSPAALAASVSPAAPAVSVPPSSALPVRQRESSAARVEPSAAVDRVSQRPAPQAESAEPGPPPGADAGALSAWPERPWVVERGEDGFGRYASFTVGGVVQRMRWIPPGVFWMGSPENEIGRYPDESPRHEVELTRGLWLAETPCTQALWEAVMGSNPSSFRSPQRPVERVSWEDCQIFLEKLNARVPGLLARLPTEAQWEHACRGGTAAATWAGDLDLIGENNAPVLDAIAWYGGNSGVGFELEGGADSTQWPEKQYPHTRAGTRPVGKKPPNPLGLHDMLGNVWEWCEDGLRRYTVGRALDPRGPPPGSKRVLRGGSWDSNSWFVRAAKRNALAPGFRGDFLGLRLARGPVL